MAFCHIHRTVALSATIREPAPAGGVFVPYRDTQLDNNMQKVRDLRTLSPKWDM